MPTFLWTIAAVVLVGAWLWSIVAMRYLGGLGKTVRSFGLAILAATPLAVWGLFGPGSALVVVSITIVGVGAAWKMIGPRNDLDWAEDQARIPRIEYHGDSDAESRSTSHATSPVQSKSGSKPDLVTIHNLRRATYRTTTDFDVEWYSHTFNLAEVQSVDYVVEPFGSFRAMAHTFVTFGFANGDYLPISIEIRRERPEKFNPVAGMFRQYELMYVMGDERDLIGLRSNIRKDDVYVYPIRATPNQVRRLLESMLARAARLNDHPEFYNTLTNNCATNVLRHLNEIGGGRFRLDYRVIAPGLSDRYAYDNGLVDTDLPFDRVRDEFRINDRSDFGSLDSRQWSEKIRTRPD